MRIHPWLPERTSFGEKPACDNCKRFGEDCGRSRYICGNWEEAEQIQMTLKTENKWEEFDDDL